MALMIENDPVPMAVDGNGVVRIGGTRVPLETVITAFERGANPAEIVSHYSVLKLADVYAVIAYYLRHFAEVKAYIKQQDEQAMMLRQEVEARQGPVATREQLLARRAARHSQTEDSVG